MFIKQLRQAGEFLQSKARESCIYVTWRNQTSLTGLAQVSVPVLHRKDKLSNIKSVLPKILVSALQIHGSVFKWSEGLFRASQDGSSTNLISNGADRS